MKLTETQKRVIKAMQSGGTGRAAFWVEGHLVKINGETICNVTVMNALDTTGLINRERLDVRCYGKKWLAESYWILTPAGLVWTDE